MSAPRNGCTEPLSTPNSRAPWDSFDSDDYFRHNYVTVRADDWKIVEFVRDHFARCAPAVAVPAIDVGTGPNVYPALAMLPFASTITLYEYSAGNVEWLKREREAGWPSTPRGPEGFWALYAKEDHYARLGPEPWRELSDRTEIVQGSVFDLYRTPAEKFGLGTMFFVAESLSDDRSEFEDAVARFLGVLRPGAPFAAAFMEKSVGYDVGGTRFPATAVDADDVFDVLRRGAEDLRVERIDADDDPLRDGYTGMLLAMGRVAGGSA